MTKVYVSSVIGAPAQQVWQLIRDFNALPDWHPGISSSRIEQERSADSVGCVRHFYTKEGGEIREQLLALSDFDFTCTYSIIESPMALTDYVATLKLTPVTDGNHAFAEWQAEFHCHDADETMLSKLIGQEVFQAGMDALKRRYEGV